MKYIFIINNLEDSHWRNRVDEFVDRGHEVILYAYSRNGGVKTFKSQYDVTVLEDFPNTMSYGKRLVLFLKTLRQVVKRHKKENACYYFFGLDLAMITVPFLSQPYLYEEFDLMHTYVGNAIVRNVMEWIDKRIIRKSKLTLLTSEGFAEYHFGDKLPGNICFVPNRLNPKIQNYAIKEATPIDMNHIRFGFVGGPRYKTMANFAKVIAERFPQHEMHFYGRIDLPDEHFFTELKKKPNVFFHGAFMNPDDLPEIYSKIDILLSAYDADYENVRYAEPNKIYESVYFEKPIVVSSNTFLANKVRRWGIGWDVNCMNDDEVAAFINGLSLSNIEEKRNNTRKIEKKDTLNINDELFNKL